jgi:hypothetical protein
LCGHPLQERRGGNVKSDIVGHLRYDIGWRNAVFGIGTDCVGAGNPVTDTKRRNPITHRGDRPGDLGSEDKRYFVRVQPGPEVCVDEIHADRLGFDQHLARAGGGLRPVDVVEDFWSAVLGDFNGLHNRLISRRHPAAGDGTGDNDQGTPVSL